jgi:hypothetical protein
MGLSGKPVGYVVVEKDELMDLIKCQQGNYCHSQWADIFSITAFLDENFQEETDTTRLFQMKPGKIQIKLFGGLASAPISPLETFVESEFGVEILAAHDLCKLRSNMSVYMTEFHKLLNLMLFSYFHVSVRGKDGNFYPNPLAVLFWNGIEVGRSNTCKQTINPVFKVQKIKVQFPKIDPLLCSLHVIKANVGAHVNNLHNELRVELWHSAEFSERYNVLFDNQQSKLINSQYLGGVKILCCRTSNLSKSFIFKYLKLGVVLLDNEIKSMLGSDEPSTRW